VYDVLCAAYPYSYSYSYSYIRYGPTDATIQGPFRAGQAVDFKVTVSAYHEGWVEMRLCEERKPASGADFGAATKVTQECLNKHVLKLDVAYTQTRRLLRSADCPFIRVLGFL
jgi:hypothetical protein